MPNFVLTSAPRYGLGTITIGPSEVATMPKTNLDNDEPSDKCRINSVDPLKTYVHTTLEMPGSYYADTFKVGAVAVVNHTLGLGSTARTLFLSSGAAGYVPERVLPNGIVTTGVWSGTAADIDEDPFTYANDGELACNNVGTNTVRIQFATPSASPATGTDRQLFRVLTAYSQIPDSVTFKLYENGVERATLSTTIEGADPRLPSSGNRVVLIPWDAADLSTADGSLVELYCEVEIGTGDDFDIRAADWACDSGLSSGSILWDSGWTAATYDAVDAQFGSTVAGTVGVAPTQNLLHYSTSGDISNVAAVVTYFRDPSKNDGGYIDLGCYVVGPIFQTALNRAYGDLVGVVDLSVKKQTHGGQTFGVKRPRLRRLRLPVAAFSAAEGHAFLDRVVWRKGILSPVFLALFPDDPIEGKHTQIWCTLENATDLSAPDPSGFRTMDATFLEKL